MGPLPRRRAMPHEASESTSSATTTGKSRTNVVRSTRAKSEMSSRMVSLAAMAAELVKSAAPQGVASPRSRASASPPTNAPAPTGDGGSQKSREPTPSRLESADAPSSSACARKRPYPTITPRWSSAQSQEMITGAIRMRTSARAFAPTISRRALARDA